MSGFVTSLAGSGAIVAEVGQHTFKDTAGTIPCSADGDLVAAFKVAGLNMVQATSGNRPVFHTAVGPPLANHTRVPVMKGDGVSQFLLDAGLVIGASQTCLVVGKWDSRYSNTQTLFGFQAGNFFDYNLGTGRLSFYGGTAVADCGDNPPPSHFSLNGFKQSGGSLTLITDDFSPAAASVDAYPGGTGFSLFAGTGGANPAHYTVAMLIIVPTAALTSGNITTLVGELAAYYDGCPFRCQGTDVLWMTDGNSITSNGLKAATVTQEFQRVAAVGITGNSVPDIRDFGAAGDTTASMVARKTYLLSYPAKVGRTNAQTIISLGEGYNDPSASAAFIQLCKDYAAGGMAFVEVLPPMPTSGWGIGGGDSAVTAFHDAVMAADFSAFPAVNKRETRVAPLTTNPGGSPEYSDPAHLSTQGHADLGVIVHPDIQTAVNKVGYPAITAQPTGATVNAGTPFTITLTATGATKTFQVRKNGVNIGGATSLPYTNSSPVVGDSGSYDVVVTQGGVSSVTSNAVAVTVNAVTIIPLPNRAWSGRPRIGRERGRGR